MKTDIRSQNNIGINTNPMLMSLGCRDVDESNGKVFLGNQAGFNGSTYSIVPSSWDSKRSFVPSRLGLSHNFKQPALSINTWAR